MEVFSDTCRSVYGVFSRNSIKSLLLILILAASIRFLYVARAESIDPILRQNALHGDAAGYDLSARNLARGLGITWYGEQPSSYRMPGYAVLLVILHRGLGPDLLLVRLVQALFGTLLCIPVYVIGQSMGGTAVGLLAAIGIALHPVLVYMTAWIYPETAYLLLLWSSIMVLVMGLAPKVKPWTLGMSGFFLAMATYMRPEAALFPLMLAFLGLALSWQRAQILAMGIVCVVLFLSLSPWALRNAGIHGAFVPLTTSAGSNFYAGNNAQSGGGSAWSPVLAGYSEFDSDQELRKRSLRWIREQPVAFIKLLPQKLRKFLSPIEFETRGSLFGGAGLLINLAYGGFLLVAMCGAILSWRSISAQVLVVLIVYYSLIALVFYGGTRVALPIAPALVLLAAFCLADLGSKRLPRLVL